MGQLNVRFQYPTGALIGYSIERLSDHLFYDFSDGTFKATPTTAVSDLTEGTGRGAGQYTAILTPTTEAVFPDGDYCLAFHERDLSDQTIGFGLVTMFNGDDRSVFPPGSASVR